MKQETENCLQIQLLIAKAFEAKEGKFICILFFLTFFVLIVYRFFFVSLINTKFSIKIPSQFLYQHSFLVLNQHFFRIISTQNIESKCKLKPQTYWINTKFVLNYLELKINLCDFRVDILIDTIIALKQHNLSVERYINHFKVSIL
jgi:hypothetical protein